MSPQQIDHLVKMANQIALNLGEQRNPELAAAKTAEHIGKFWTRDMVRQLADHIRNGGEGMSPVVAGLALDNESLPA